LDDPLIWVRAIQFAATVSVSGVVIFEALVGAPALRTVPPNEPMAGVVRLRLGRIAWCSLVLVALSAIAWLIAQSVQMSGQSFDELWSGGALATVLFDTDFGHVWLARCAVMALLAVALFPSYFNAARPSPSRRGVALVSAAALAGALAFSGHAAAGAGAESVVHEGADVLHLLAAAAWAGALVPLAVLLGAAANDRGQSSLAVARVATRRFSTLGIVSVATILVTGLVNTWELAGSAAALFGTDYGRLLLAKIALFLVMVAVAAVNRLLLTPRLVQGSDLSGQRDTLRRLRSNSLIEALLAAVILFIVGVLGTLPPGSEATIGLYALPQVGKS
jgi:putative copper resistance protein D